ncbi:MAG: peptide chain release factor 2 [Ardenticatenales bacterium]|nr:peptide chain release factor 2 [Ardenticatenales bacterium]MCB9171935.1 peptide chain release factor 2 [Ardenticatenales bacterium]
MTDAIETLKRTMQRIEGILCAFDVPNKELELAAMEQETLSPGFWDDNERAQRIMRRQAALRDQVTPWRTLETRTHDALELSHLIDDEAAPDAALVEEIEREASEIAADYDAMEFKVALGGEHDGSDAILSIFAGAGGTESQDWAEMLFRMYLRWADQQGFQSDIIDRTEGEQAGIKSATIEIAGPYAYGYLKSEKGPHRLVRISPFDSSSRRHTSFAGVDVMPVLDDDVAIEIDPNDVEMDVFKASGAGGQHVQKNSTAVRLVHKPTGIVVTCQNERSQTQNREQAMKVLRSKLYEVEQERLEEERARIAGSHKTAEWGNQIRSYVLHPYQMVKDHRTNAETSNTQAVLDGELTLFTNAYLKHQLGDE